MLENCLVCKVMRKATRRPIGRQFLNTIVRSLLVAPSAERSVERRRALTPRKISLFTSRIPLPSELRAYIVGRSAFTSGLKFLIDCPPRYWPIVFPTSACQPSRSPFVAAFFSLAPAVCKYWKEGREGGKSEGSLLPFSTRRQHLACSRPRPRTRPTSGSQGLSG